MLEFKAGEDIKKGAWVKFIDGLVYNIDNQKVQAMNLIHECAICGKRFSWNKQINPSWRYQIIDKGYEGYEIEIKFCDIVCKRLDQFPKKVNTKKIDKFEYDNKKGFYIFKDGKK